MINNNIERCYHKVVGCRFHSSKSRTYLSQGIAPPSCPPGTGNATTIVSFIHLRDVFTLWRDIISSCICTLWISMCWSSQSSLESREKYTMEAITLIISWSFCWTFCRALWSASVSACLAVSFSAWSLLGYNLGPSCIAIQSLARTVVERVRAHVK